MSSIMTQQQRIDRLSEIGNGKFDISDRPTRKFDGPIKYPSPMECFDMFNLGNYQICSETNFIYESGFDLWGFSPRQSNDKTEFTPAIQDMGTLNRIELEAAQQKERTIRINQISEIWDDAEKEGIDIFSLLDDCEYISNHDRSNDPIPEIGLSESIVARAARGEGNLIYNNSNDKLIGFEEN